jgi:sarcosine oxidase
MFDSIVLGVGGMGSATLYQLARRGVRVLGLERFDIPHDRGSSHGVTRLIRLAYAEHPAYVPLLRRAYELWRDLEQVSGERLLIVTGGLDIGYPVGQMVKGSLLSCEVHDLPHEVLDARALNARFPGFVLPDELVGVLQPDAGFLLPERCIVAHVEAAQALGAEVHAREAVDAWHVSNGHVEVHTRRSTYRARRLVITAGPWAASQLPFLSGLAVPERQVVIWVQPRRPELFRVGRFPVFNMQAAEGHYYGVPIYSVPGVKLGKYHHLHQRVDPDAVDREIHLEDEQLLREGIARYLPDADGPAMALKTCVFTNSPDEHFILDRHPETPSVVLAAGFSGHGYKFCSVVGEIMADLAMDGGSRFDLSLFRLGRFERSPPVAGRW